MSSFAAAARDIPTLAQPRPAWAPGGGGRESRSRSATLRACPTAALGGCACRGAHAERGAQLDVGVADLFQGDLAGHVLGDPGGYGLAARFGLRTRIPGAHREHFTVSDRDRVALEPGLGL